MSTYLEDSQGNIISSPINETNTKYPWIPKNKSDVKDAMDNKLDYQYMYNEDSPVSNIDTDAYDSYRNTVEELRKKTESHYEALESCLVPTAIKGMAFQPWEYVKDAQGKDTTEKKKSLQYFFQDHPSNISSDANEFVFRTNKVKFIDDRRRRLIYDRSIHILSTKEDEDNKVSFKDVLLRTFFTQYNGHSWCEVRTLENRQSNINDILNDVVNLNTKKPDNEKLVVIDENDEEKVVETVADLDYPMQAGQDVCTGIPSTLYNLYTLGWVHAAIVFLNGLAVEWTKTLISVDNIDTFVIIRGLREELNGLIDNTKEITMEYVYIPFKCVYTVGSETIDADNPKSQFLKNGMFETVPFVIDTRYGAMIETTDSYRAPTCPSMYYDRIICADPNVVYKEFVLNSDNEQYLPDIGVQFCKAFKDFCNNDYRTKLKQFNFLGFEINKTINAKYAPTTNHLRTLKNDDFSITWHPFNILDIRFKHLYNNRRVFKVFYNTRVLYDQDNVLRIRNKGDLRDEYERYRQSVTANIDLYIRELYVLAKKDIGTYVATSTQAFVEGFKYHYVSPYECFLLYNALQTFLGFDGQTVNFDEFRKINVINYPLHKKISDSGGGGEGGGGGGDGFDFIYPEYIYDDPDEDDFFQPVVASNNVQNDDEVHYIGFMNGGFIVYDDDHNFFDAIVKKETLYDDEGNLREEISDYWQSIVDKDPENKNLMDFLFPIDDVRNIQDSMPTNTNIFYMYNGDNKGKIQPYSKYMSFCEFKQEVEELTYDYLKLRFELSYINNMEEGATPVDELIYYFDNVGLNRTEGHYTVNSYENRYTANLLNELASNIFQYDPNMVLRSIKRMNYKADYIIPKSLGDIFRDDFIVVNASSSDVAPVTDAEYPKYPIAFYNYGYYDNNNKPHKLNDEWCLRRNLHEMFYWSTENENFVIDSMHILDEVFDFDYDATKTYEENLVAGTKYILGYDADKLEASIKRGIVSFTKSGRELKAYMNNHPAVIYTSTDNYKRIQFNSNQDYIVTVNNERLYVYINDNSTSFSYVDENGVEKHDNTIFLKYKGQVNDTIEINQASCYIKDIDKNFTAYYATDKTKYNDETQMVEFYNNNNELVVTLQADAVYTYHKLQMSRWNISKQDNYVMIFKNRKLYDRYSSIHYSDIAFDVDMEMSDIDDDDMFEFVFFLNANNTIITKECRNTEAEQLVIPDAYYSKSVNQLRTDKNGDKYDKGLYENISSNYTFERGIACHTDVIEPENVQLLVSVMPRTEDDTFIGSGANLAYELNYTVYSYKATTSNDNTERTARSIAVDNKVNGLYRVTKQGGGEYFLTYDGTVPEKTDTITTPTSDPQFIDYGYSTNRTISPSYKLYLSSKRQFRYQHNTIVENHDSGFYINLDTSFKYCVKNSHMMVFKNGLLLPPTYYFLRPIINTPIGAVAVVFNVELAAGDEIDMFYVTNDLHHLECDYYDIANQERYIQNGDVRVNVNNNEYRVMGEMSTDRQELIRGWRTNYIKMRSPLYAISSKNSTFVFLNGKKVRNDEITDISDTIMGIDTDYARNGDDMQAVRLEVINHLDTQDIIERLYINDGLNHEASVAQNQFVNTNNQNAYKNTLQINSFSLTDLDEYAERTKLDEMLNDLSDENLNKLFYNWNTAKGPMTPEGIMNEPDFANNDVIVETIIDEFYVEEDGDKFIWHTIPTEIGIPGQSNTIFYIGESESVKVPARWNDENTRALYGTTFNRNKSGLKKIVIPEGVTSIE